MTTSEPTTGEIVGALRYKAGISHGYSHAYVAPETLVEAADRLESQDRTIADLTARAEQAEAREKAAVKDLEELLAQEDFMGVCWACGNRTQCDKNLFAGGKCEPTWRGLPQEGEG